MAKVVIDQGVLDIRVGLLERVMLAERSRKLPLSQVRRVDPEPPLLEMMLHWSEHSTVWLAGSSAYEGHMIPSTRNPKRTLSIELETDERIYVEVDDEPPAQTAQRISHAIRGTGPESTEESMAHQAHATPSQPPQEALMQALDVELDEDVQLRDPLMQGSLPPPPPRNSEPAKAMRLDDDRDLTRLGGWLVGLGTLGLLTGGVMLASGALPGLLAAGAGVASAVLGGVALAVVAHHQG